MNNSRMDYAKYEFEITLKVENQFKGNDLKLVISSAAKLCQSYRSALRFNKSVSRECEQIKKTLESYGVKFKF